MKKILIVEDEAFRHYRCINKAKQFCESKYHLDIAISIEAANNCLRKNHYDLIILDIMMDPSDYGLQATNDGMETGLLYYQNHLKNLNSKIVLWTRYINLFDKDWGSNVINKKVKNIQHDDELIEIIKKNIDI